MLSNKAKLTIFLIFIIVLSSVLVVDGFKRRGPRGGGGSGGGGDGGNSSGPLVYCCTYGIYGWSPYCFDTTTAECIALDGAFTCLDAVNASISTTIAATGTTATSIYIATPTQDLIPYPININDTFIVKLIDDALKSGIGNRIYNPGPSGTIYICDNFADDLQQYLNKTLDSNGVPYNVTFTVVHTYTWHAWQRDLALLQTEGKGHCYVDVHKNGKVLFIEAQRTENGDIRIFANLDYTGNGKVTAHVDQTMQNHNDERTEIYKQINIYKSKAKAKSYGQPFGS